jgi:hypothetical protein
MPSVFRSPDGLRRLHSSTVLLRIAGVDVVGGSDLLFA